PYVVSTAHADRPSAYGMETDMMHIATTEKGYVSFYEHIHRAISGFVARRRARASEREARERILNLATLDDRMLDDIGISRAEVFTAAELPVEMNASMELRRMAAERRSRESRVRRAA